MSEDLLHFEDFVLNRGAHELRRDGVVVPLQRIPLELLCLLLERRGQLVTREEILERVWGKGVFVDAQNSINTAVRKVRRALGDNPEAPRFVVTVPARGYRFIAQIRPPKTSRAEYLRPRAAGLIVGREREIASLLSGLDSAAAGRGRLFLISGEAGVGKTRLADEVAAAAQARRIALMVGHCSEHDEAVAYLPFVEILENFVDRVPDLHTLRSALGDECRELARLLPKLKSILPELPPPLELPPAQARRHLFNCFSDFIARIASQQPALMILEDLHWADDSTLSLLNHLTERLSALPLMVIGTHRDAELNVTRPLAKMLEDLLRGRLATRVKLEGLPRDEVAAMLNSLSGKSPPAAVVGKIFAETEGNPFFVEELFRHLEEEDRLYDSSGQFRAELKIGELDAPPSVRLVVARRLARLSDLTQRMLATAAVIGRFFSFEVLQASSESDADSLLDAVEQAEKAGLICSVVESAKPRFEFSHELIRQAVLAGLSAARRQRLHLEVAEAIERACSAASASANNGGLDDHVAELAHHYTLGGSPAKAAKYCMRAVRRFADLGSNAEALAQFESGLELLTELPDDDRRAELELDLRNAVFGPLGDSKGYASPEAEQSIARAAVLARRPGTNWTKTWTALSGIFFVHQLRPDVREAGVITTELVARAEEHGSIGYLAESLNWLGYTRMVSGAFELADQAFDRAWALLESMAKSVPGLSPVRAGQTRHDWKIVHQAGTRQNNRVISGWNLWFLGYPDRALERIGIATAIAQEPGAPKDMLADIYGFAAYIYELRREPEQMRARAEARLSLATESGFFTGRALSEIYLGWADAMAGNLDGGIARMRRHMLELKAAGSEYISDRCLTFIAQALSQLGRFDESLRLIEESLQFMERTGQRYYEAELHRMKGELLLARASSNAEQAAQSFHTAIEIARKQHAKSWELRATTNLARLLAKQHKQDKARPMLTEIYGSFTEGFDTPDLKDAKSLLAELEK
jgi:DNA-binding winged helix-turn-helix (wHTH) protein/tetratricopeptide (TPR) repeat protein